jgi:hypothetical protein
MVFATITKKAQLYGQGNCIGTDRFELPGGLKMFFYDMATIHEEFGKAGLFEILDVIDIFPFYLIKCKKDKMEKLVAEKSA